MKLFIFDFDGTLVDSKPVIEAGMAHTLARLDLPLGLRDEWLKYVGLPVEVGIRRTFPLDGTLTYEKVLAAYRTFDHQGHEPLIGAFEGIPELIEALHGQGRPMAIATSKRNHGLKPTMERMGWWDWFDPIVTPDEVENAKPHPESLHQILERTRRQPEDCVMIGDTPFDMDMATAAGVPGLAVGYGMYSGEALAPHHPRYYASDVPALRDILLSL
ncbi:MAG: HAD family hydrolase [Acidobacteriota bacterium]|nr:HAD family hydrolase [Acidobacteriota bacterium]